MIEPGSTIGILGGGQLGKMLAMAAAHLGYHCCVFDPNEDAPAFEVCAKHVVATFDDRKALEDFAKQVDVITLEFENIPYDVAAYIGTLKPLHPSAELLDISQHRLKEKHFINQLGIATAVYMSVSNDDEFIQAQAFQYPCILKTARFGYDGKGQYRIDCKETLEKLWGNLPKDQEFILEACVDFIEEVSILVARKNDGVMVCYPLARNIHQDGILKESHAPYQHKDLQTQAEDIAKKIAVATDLVGILAVEFFVTKQGQLLVNEIAPRPHNSGHWTLDGCVTSQFEQAIRAVCGLPLGSVEVVRAVTMKNWIGEDIHSWKVYINDPYARLYIYGKSSVREGRKMGHVNLIHPGKALDT